MIYLLFSILLQTFANRTFNVLLATFEYDWLTRRSMQCYWLKTLLVTATHATRDAGQDTLDISAPARRMAFLRKCGKRNWLPPLFSMIRRITACKVRKNLASSSPPLRSKAESVARMTSSTVRLTDLFRTLKF